MSKEKENLLMALTNRKEQITGWVRHYTFPPFIDRNEKLLIGISLTLFIFITLFILISIGIDLFYLIFLGEDILGGDVQSYLSPDCAVSTCT